MSTSKSKPKSTTTATSAFVATVTTAAVGLGATAHGAVQVLGHTACNGHQEPRGTEGGADEDGDEGKGEGGEEGHKREETQTGAAGRHTAILAEAASDAGLLMRAEELVSPVVVVRDVAGLQDCLASASIPDTPDLIAIDTEGVALGRHGSVRTVQLRFWSDGPCYVLEVDAIQKGMRGQVWSWKHPVSHVSLCSLLEDRRIRLLYVDCRKDAETLFHVHGVKQRNVYDLQVADAAARCLETGEHPRAMRPASKLLSRVTTPKQHAVLSELQALGHRVHSCAGGTRCWADAPVHRLMVLYAASDVFLLHGVYHALRECIRRRDTGTMFDAWVRKTSEKRLRLAHSGSSAMSREDMWRHPDLIQLVNPCMSALVPDLPRPTLLDTKRHAMWHAASKPALPFASVSATSISPLHRLRAQLATPRPYIVHDDHERTALQHKD